MPLWVCVWAGEGVGSCVLRQDEDTADPEGLSERPEDYSSDEDGRAQPISPSKAHSLPAGTALSSLPSVLLLCA